jgi:DNA-nicking Smr family endonuclease
MNDDDLFLKEMKGVNPIKKNNKVEIVKKKIKINKIIRSPKNKTVNDVSKKTQITTKTKISKFKLENINIKKNLKNKSFKIDKKIDFHGKTLIDSEEEFFNTVINCYNQGLRCLLFVTGKGLFKLKENQKELKPKLYHGVIRSSFINWVKSDQLSKYILSYESALIDHGGDGAFYVYLRKKKINIAQV